VARFSVTRSLGLGSAANPAIAYWVDDMMAAYNEVLLYDPNPRALVYTQRQW